MNRLATWITHAAALAPQATALICGGAAISYSALDEHGRSERAADTARFPTSAVELAFSAYRAAYRGQPFFPANPTVSAPNFQAWLEQATNSRDGGAVELIIATSGSEGEPKGVMLSGANLAAAVAASGDRLPLHEGDVWLDCLPLYHIGGMAILYRCAAARATVLLHEGFDARLVWDDLARYAVTHISLVPAMLARLLDITHGAPPPETLKYALIGGAALSGELAARARLAGWPLCVTYGMSETASQLASLFPLPEDWTPGCVGTPLTGFEVRIAAPDENGNGVIQARGAAVMAGYINPELIPGDGLADGWFTSGDLGRLDRNGRLHVLGRRDDMLVSGGVNLHPATVEAALLHFPGLRDVAVTALADEVWGDRLVALVVGKVDLEQLEGWCREHLAGAMRPRLLRAVAELPRNALGKLERAKLKNMVRELVQNVA